VFGTIDLSCGIRLFGIMFERCDFDPEEHLGEKFMDCCRCGVRYKHAEVWFDSGSTEPTVGEVFTGATSGDTGVVVGTELYSGSWAGGDAAGVVTLSTLTGVSKDSDTLIETVFQNDEEINGATAGDSCMTVDGTPEVKKYGRMYPESLITVFRGQRYCRAHFDSVWRKKLIDEQPFFIDEGDRGEVW